MDFEIWIDRERKVRIKIIESSSPYMERSVCRVCRACDEICLCHEEKCPNCDSDNIRETQIERHILISGARIRCRLRFNRLRKK